ncbi:unnamed protein product [Sympodiomycopsis kandeliae]
MHAPSYCSSLALICLSVLVFSCAANVTAFPSDVRPFSSYHTTSASDQHSWSIVSRGATMSQIVSNCCGGSKGRVPLLNKTSSSKHSNGSIPSSQNSSSGSSHNKKEQRKKAPSTSPPRHSSSSTASSTESNAHTEDPRVRPDPVRTPGHRSPSDSGSSTSSGYGGGLRTLKKWHMRPAQDISPLSLSPSPGATPGSASPASSHKTASRGSSPEHGKSNGKGILGPSPSASHQSANAGDQASGPGPSGTKLGK